MLDKHTNTTDHHTNPVIIALDDSLDICAVSSITLHDGSVLIDHVIGHVAHLQLLSR